MVRRASRVDIFQGKLELFKHDEKAEAVLLVAQDKQLVRLLLVWEKVAVQRKSRLSKAPEGENRGSFWQWLCENVPYRPEELVALSGLSPELVEKNMAVLRGNRLIYPDGTMNRFVAQYLTMKVLGLFKSKVVKKLSS